MISILPKEDWIEHTDSTDCVCDPAYDFDDGELMIFHNAVDGRKEEIEYVE